MCPRQSAPAWFARISHLPARVPGKDAAGVWGGSFRVPAAEAWTFPELELGRTGNSIPALLFDLDGDPTDWLVDVLGPALPRPNWIVWRRENMHAHVAYTLARAVLTGEQAKRTPQAFLARVGEYMAAELKADAAYSAVLGHNPISQASHGRYTTDWLREEPYSLAELVAFVPKGWRRPILQPQTIYGRNDALFRAGMKWSGAPRNWGNWAGLASSLRVKNQGFIEPLGERELGGIVKSVVRYQRRNLESGKQQQDLLVYPGGSRQEVRPGATDENRRSRRGYRGRLCSGPDPGEPLPSGTE